LNRTLLPPDPNKPLQIFANFQTPNKELKYELDVPFALEIESENAKRYNLNGLLHVIFRYGEVDDIVPKQITIHKID